MVATVRFAVAEPPPALTKDLGAGPAEACRVVEERGPGPDTGGASICNGALAPTFTPGHDVTLCSVSAPLRPGESCEMPLHGQDVPDETAFVYTQAS